MIGVNTTETTAALNDSVQLLSMGIVPDSVGLSPKLLPSFKDFDDDDKRLDAAYRRQVSGNISKSGVDLIAGPIWLSAEALLRARLHLVIWMLG